MTDFAGPAIIMLAIIGAIGVLMAIAWARRIGSPWNVPSGLLVMFVIVVPVSGIVHLMRIPGGTRGFYDVLSHSQPEMGSNLTSAILISLGSLVSIWVGSMLVTAARAGTTKPVFKAARSTAQKWVIAGVTMLPVCYLALVQVQALRSVIDSTRVWGFDGGNARLVFLASWLPWAITFLALAAANTARSPLLLLAIGAAGIYLIYIATDWSGGRSLILLFAFPLVAWLFPRLGRLRLVALVGTGAAIIWALVAGTLERTATFAVQEVNLPGIIDWEWGRFSMSAFASGYVDANGILFGESYLAAVLQVPTAILNVLGADIEVGLRSISQITSSSLLGSETLNYTVPGAIAEAYMNLGIVGVIGAMLFLGAAATWLDRLARTTSSASVQVLASYFIAILLFRALVAESVSLFTYAAFTGLPLIVMAALDRSKTRPSATGTLHLRLPASSPRESSRSFA